MATVLIIRTSNWTRKGGNCDALQLEAARRRTSHSGLFLVDLLLRMRTNC